MTTTAGTINVEQETSKLANLRADYESRQAQLPALISDPVALNAAVGAMAELLNEIKRTQGRIDRAVGGGESLVKVEARQNAFNALHAALANIPEVAAFKAVNPALKEIRIQWAESGAITFDSVGGMRTVKPGVKRTRKVYTGKGLPAEGARMKGVIAAFGQKHGQTEPYDKMSTANRQALMEKIVKAEKLVLVSNGDVTSR